MNMKNKFNILRFILFKNIFSANQQFKLGKRNLNISASV